MPSSNALQICFVCNEYPPGPHGGIGTFTRVLARELVAGGHEVRVIGMYPPDYPAPDYEEDAGVRIWRMRQTQRRLGWVAARYRLHRTLSRWSKEGLIDLVEFPDWEGWAAGLPRLKVPVVVRLNGCASYFAKELDRTVNRTTFRVERAGLRRADFWCSVSEYTAHRTMEVFGHSCGPDAILYNSVEEPQEVTEVTRSENQIVYTGTLTKKKGILSLIEAWPEVIRVVQDAELHVYGKDGRTDQGESMQSYLERQVAQGNGSVRFHGHVSRDLLFRKLSVARAAVFPSYAEAFALAPLEAMVRGCPTVYSTRGSGKELIDDGHDGLLVDPDRPQDIAAALIKLLTDSQLAQRIGEAGRQRVLEKFTVATMRETNEAFYRECVGRFGSSAMDPGKSGAGQVVYS